MKYLLSFLLGGMEIRVSKDAVLGVLNYLNAEKIPFEFLQSADETVLFRFFVRYEKRVVAYFTKTEKNYKIEKRFGLPQIWTVYKHRAGVLAGCILFFSALFIAPKFIWQVNITGLKQLNRADVEQLLAKEGVYVGSFSSSIDRERVYTNILQASEEISWLSVNIQGSSANVEIIERASGAAMATLADGANIIAAKDGQILDTKITRGKRIVENGAVVKKGALLVSGVYDTGKMGTRFVHADAAVYAQVTDTFSVKVPLDYTGHVYYAEKEIAKAIKIFGKQINIFKNYSKQETNCDIINRKESLPWDGLDRLPVSFETTVAFFYAEQPIRLTESAALDRAKAELHRKIADANYKELLAREDSYTVENGVLCYHCRVEAIQNIATVSTFSID